MFWVIILYSPLFIGVPLWLPNRLSGQVIKSERKRGISKLPVTCPAIRESYDHGDRCLGIFNLVPWESQNKDMLAA
jgi:hypothetical protein